MNSLVGDLESAGFLVSKKPGKNDLVIGINGVYIGFLNTNKPLNEYFDPYTNSTDFKAKEVLYTLLYNNAFKSRSVEIKSFSNEYITVHIPEGVLYLWPERHYRDKP